MKDPRVSEVLRRSKRQLPRRPTVQSETKYIELMVVNDYEMVSRPFLKRTDVCESVRVCDAHTHCT